MDFLDAPLISLSTLYHSMYRLGKSFRASTKHCLKGWRTTAEFPYKADTGEHAHAVWRSYIIRLVDIGTPNSFISSSDTEFE